MVHGRRIRLAVATVAAHAIAALALPVAAAPRIDKASANLERALAQPLSQLDGGGATMASGEGMDGYRVDVVLDGQSPALAEQLEAAGARVHSVSQHYERASISVPGASAVRELARLDAVEMMYPEYGFVRGVGSVDSRAPKALKVDGGRTNEGFRTTGGERVGILSDSFARTSGVVDGDTITDGTPISSSGNRNPVTLEKSKPQDADDLPDEVELRRDDGLNPTDEGAAMAELVHDMARDAAISFHTVGNNVGTFAEGIDDLCTARGSGGAGASVVVDDVIFFAESMYQRGPIAQAAEDCVTGGVPYLSAAGNSADNALRRDYTDLDPNSNDDAPSPSNGGPSDRASALDAADLHDFGGDDPGFVEVQLPAGGRILAVLQWNQPALSVPGNDSNGPEIDLDLLALDTPSADPSNLITDSAGNPLSSFEDQAYEDGGGGADPTEIVSIANGSNSKMSLYLAVDHWAGSRSAIPQAGSTDLEFRLVIFELTGEATIQYIDDSGGDSTMYGHRTGTGVISVAAVPWWDTPEFDTTFGPTDAIDPEPFTAEGGRLPIQFARDGRFIGEEKTARHPRITAIDGNNNTFFGQDLKKLNAFGEPDNIPNFLGTSAAAPNAAAVLAGLQGISADPLTPSKVERLLRSDAVAITGQRASPKEDDVTGAGLIDAGKTAARFPTARAAGPGDVGSGASNVELDGTRSSAPADIQSFQWRQVSGKRVTLRDSQTAQPTFDAPAERTTLVFELKVTGDSGLTNADRVSVGVAQDLELSGSSGSGGGGSLGLLSLGLLTAFVACHIGGRRCSVRPGLA